MDYEDWIFLYNRDNWLCPCGRASSQIAHRIPDGKYGKSFIYRTLLEILHVDYVSASEVMMVLWHPLNLRTVCSLECNHKQSISNHPLDMVDLIKEIVYELAWIEPGTPEGCPRT